MAPCAMKSSVRHALHGVSTLLRKHMANCFCWMRFHLVAQGMPCSNRRAFSHSRRTQPWTCLRARYGSQRPTAQAGDLGWQQRTRCSKHQCKGLDFSYSRHRPIRAQAHRVLLVAPPAR